MKRVLWVVLAGIILLPLGIIGVQLAADPVHQASVPVANLNEQIANGEYLTRAGNCMACHTSRSGAAFAGGRAIATPFGDIYSSNITPDSETGIGTWTSDDFWRAIHNGKSKDGKFLYPAFPYPNYTKVTRADADAMFAWLRTVKPVRQANRDHALRFPYDQRILMAFWRSLYFTPGEYQTQADRSVDWNRGAYLVQGLGHCSACHTGRNALGGTIASGNLAGGMIPMQNWYASSLTSGRETGLGEWDVQEITDLLHTGVSQRGAVFGPMSEVVSGSLQHLNESDIQAMAAYLKSVPDRGVSVNGNPTRISNEAKTILELGANVYEKHCVECHKADGKGVPPGYPPLAGNRSLTAQPAINLIRMVLNGGYPPSTKGNPRPYGMPPFSLTLNDTEVAAVVSFIRSSWGNTGGIVSPIDVGRYRGAPAN